MAAKHRLLTFPGHEKTIAEAIQGEREVWAFDLDRVMRVRTGEVGDDAM
jgi:nitrogen regulatory protein PII